MAINPKTRAKIDNEQKNECNELIVVQTRIARYADMIDGALDPALVSLGYDPGEITQLRNIATAYHAIATAITNNSAALEAIADTHLY